jgi:hypothetical protein
MRLEKDVRRRTRARVALYRYSSFWFSVAMATFFVSTLLAFLQEPRDPYEPLRLDTVRGWLTPIDPGKAQELPSLRADLRAVHVDPADSQRVWVAGNAGTIFFSADGGRTWTTQAIRPPLAQTAVEPLAAAAQSPSRAKE